jgi:hypothetical protein
MKSCLTGSAPSKQKLPEMLFCERWQSQIAVPRPFHERVKLEPVGLDRGRSAFGYLTIEDEVSYSSLES